MIRVVSVEDEPLMNQFVVGSLDWGKLGMELCGVFYNGKTAYEFLKDNPADIVVTDIQMPLMDGLTLISKVCEIRPETKFIVLSNFDEFEMVKSAFKFGATDYILKTDFEPLSFQKMLIDIVNKSSLNHKTDKLSMDMREYSLKQFFWGNTRDTGAMQKMRVDVSRPMRVALLKLLNYNEILNSEWDMEKELMKFGLSNCIEETLDIYGNGEFFFNGYDEIIFLFGDSHDYCAKAQKLFDDIFRFLINNFGIVSTAAICDIFKNHAHKEQYHMADQSLIYSFLNGCNRLILCTEVLKFTEVPDINQMTSRLDSLVANMDFGSIMRVLDEINKPVYLCVPSLKDMYKKLIKKLIDVHTTYELPITVEALEEIQVDYSCVSEINSVISEVCAYLSEKLEYSDVAMAQVENYIRKNYSSNITLQFLAKQFLFSYTDLSRRFQKATGMSFSKFLNEVRLTEAMKLIKTTDYKCSQIASMVGYNNYENFSRSFKEKYQKAPNEVRKVDRP